MSALVHASQNNILDIINDRDAYAHAWSIAKMYAASQLVPPHLRGKAEDCFIALTMAHQLGQNPVIVMQNIYIVQGRAGWNAAFMIAQANRSGIFKGRIAFKAEGQGDALSVTASAVLADSDQRVEMTASMAMAKAEGWDKNPKYKSMPVVMLQYRAATLLIRAYAYDVMLGLPTVDEVETMPEAEVMQKPRGAGARVRAALEIAAAPTIIEGQGGEEEPVRVESGADDPVNVQNADPADEEP